MENYVSVKSILTSASTLLKLDEVYAYLTGEGETDSETLRETDLLVRCANLVIREVASEYVPLKIKQKVTATDGKIPFASLSNRAIDVYAVVKNGVKTDFKIFYDLIMVNGDGEYEVEYSYEPKKVLLNDFTPYLTARPSERVFAYGVAREYSLISGLGEEAEIWDVRFKDAITAFNRKKTSAVIAPRVWG